MVYRSGHFNIAVDIDTFKHVVHDTPVQHNWKSPITQQYPQLPFPYEIIIPTEVYS